MDVAHWAAGHRRSVLLLFLAIAGIMTAFQLPVALFPEVNFPRISISIEAGDRPADQMVIAVTRKIEQAVRPVPGVVSIRSTSSRGSAEASINFAWGSDMSSALLLAVAIISGLLIQTPLVTVVMPVVYRLLARIKNAD